MTIVCRGRPQVGQTIAPSDRVLVVGAYGVGNTGDEAVLAGLVRKVGVPERLTVVSRDPVATSKLHGVRAVNAWESVRELHSAVVADPGNDARERERDALKRVVVVVPDDDPPRLPDPGSPALRRALARRFQRGRRHVRTVPAEPVLG